MALAQTHLDALWDFSDARSSEARLRSAVDDETDAVSRAELETQVARALGLQERFADGHAVLDAIAAEDPVVTVRVSLERGRLRTSAGDAPAAIADFRAAAAVAASAGLVFLRVDALHMLAIVEPAHADEWTAEALAVLEDTDDPRTLRWRVSLHNNAGWAHVDAGRLPEALAAFQASRDAAAQWGTPEQIAWADEAIAALP